MNKNLDEVLKLLDSGSSKESEEHQKDNVCPLSQQLTTVTNGVVRNQQEGTAADSGKIFPNSHHQQQADVAGSPAIHFKLTDDDIKRCASFVMEL
uniref:Ovule protein n=1 Tax=Syphacia muris TaxID=451379 RepID=A0A0N5B179_9BILA